MNPANYREALIETRLDEAEGADILMVHFVSWLSSRTSVFSSRRKCGITVFAYSYIAMLLTQVKPAMPYLDVIRLLRDNTSLPISAYQVRISLH